MPHPRRWNILNATFLLGSLGLAAALVPLELAHSLRHWEEWIAFGVMVVAVGLGVTAGYHRLFSHRAYQAAWPVRLLWLCLGAASFENSVLHWASDHRVHHRHVDREPDPYNSRNGFWFAHWLWIMQEQPRPLAGVADLQKDPLVRWQHRHVRLIGAVVALAPLAVGFATGNPWGHFVIGVLLRIVVTHHTTFFINSAAHRFGTRPYTDASTARDNALLAPLTYGEGYHNYHHAFQWDYRNGARWWQFDPTKWLIYALARVGLARDLRRVPDTVIRRARLAMETKALLARLAASRPRATHAPLQARLTAARTRLDTALAALQEQLEAWEARAAERRARSRERRASLARCREELRAAFAEWKAARVAVLRARFA